MNDWYKTIPLMVCFFIIFGYAKDKQLVILQTSDLHGRIAFGKNDKGWLKVSTLITQERKKAKDHCIYIDCGDSVQGTLACSLFKGEPSIMALNYLNPDAWIPGNHEFDFGVQRLGELIGKTRFPVLNGNLTLGHPESAKIKPYRMVTINGLKVAIIGMNTGRLKSWFFGGDYDRFSVLPAVRALENLLPRVQKESPNMIILGIHQGLLEGRASHGEVYEICKRFPQIDLILGGHTHAHIPGKRLWSTYVVQPGEHGEYVGKVTATFNAGGSVETIHSALLDATVVNPDEQLRNHLERYTKPAGQASYERVGTTPAAVSPSGIPGTDNRMSDLFCRAIARAARVDCALHGVHNPLVWKKGMIYRYQVFSSIPYENRIMVVTLTAEELVQIMNEQLAFEPREHMLGIHGAKVYVAKNGKTVTRIKLPEGKQSASVALTSFAAAGGGWRYPVLRKIFRSKHPSVRELSLTTRQAVMNYIKSTDDWYHPPQTWLVFRKK